MERLPNRYPKISQSHKVPLYKGLSLFYPKLLKYIVLPTVYSFFFILFPIVGFILFRSVDEICLFVDSICCSCYASLTLMSVRRTADDE